MEQENQAAEQPKASKSAKGAEPSVTMGMSELTALVSAAVSAAVEKSSKASSDAFSELAKAIQDSRKPYKDPRAEENDALMRQQMREVNERMARNIAASQASCPHFQGSNESSDFQGALTSIVKHQLDNGVVWGICTNCLRQFWPGDPDYVKEMNRKSGNRPSRAGQRLFLNPIAAASAGRQ